MSQTLLREFVATSRFVLKLIKLFFLLHPNPLLHFRVCIYAIEDLDLCLEYFLSNIPPI